MHMVEIYILLERWRQFFSNLLDEKINAKIVSETPVPSHYLRTKGQASVADPDPGTDVFLTPGSGMGRIRDPDPG